MDLQNQKLCVFVECGKPAEGRGKYMVDVLLCREHLEYDFKQFDEVYENVRVKNEKVKQSLERNLKANKKCMLELVNDRNDAADTFDAIFERMQELRNKVLGRFDEKIRQIEENSAELESVENQEATVLEAESSNDLVRSFKLRNELQKALEGIRMQDYSTKSGNDSVEMLQMLQQNLNIWAADVESENCGKLKSMVQSMALSNSLSLNNDSVENTHITVCNNTAGFFYNNNRILSASTDRCSSFPASCVMLIKGNQVGALKFSYLSTDLHILAQSVSQTNDTKLVGASCVSHLQQIFLLGQHLTVTDLTGANLRTIENLGLHLYDMCHDTEKLYTLEGNCIKILSLETFEVINTIALPKCEVNKCMAITRRGNILLISGKGNIYRVRVNSKKMKISSTLDETRIFNIIAKMFRHVIRPRYVSMADTGCGSSAVANTSGEIKVSDCNGTIIKEITLDNPVCKSCKNVETEIRSWFDQSGTSCKLFVLFGCAHVTLVQRYNLY